MTDDALHAPQGSTQETVSQRFWMLAAVCLGLMMAAFSATMVNVALPSIGADLHMSDRHLAQILSAYVATFGGAMLMAGRLGDAFGHQRIFVIGVSLFAIASLGCGVAASARTFIVWRSVQGIGGAIVCVLAQCLAANLFEQERHRTRALGLCSVVGASGGSVGLAVGGALVTAFDWRWIFYLNVPIGAICVCGFALLPSDGRVNWKKLDRRGTAVALVLLVVVACVIGNDSRPAWKSVWPVVAFVAVSLLLVVFVCLSLRSSVLYTFVVREIALIRRSAVLNAVAAMLSVAALTWSFACTLYLQRVLAFNPWHTGLLFLPAVAGSAGASLSVTPWLVAHFGVRRAAAIGLLSVGTGLALLSRIPSEAPFLYDILPGMFLVGIGTGISYTPLIHAALRGAAPDHVGAASGLINTSYMLGGALGLSALGSIAAGHTEDLITAGVDEMTALGAGYRVALGLSAAVAFVAAFIGAAALREEAEVEKFRG